MELADGYGMEIGDAEPAHDGAGRQHFRLSFQGEFGRVLVIERFGDCCDFYQSPVGIACRVLHFHGRPLCRALLLGGFDDAENVGLRPPGMVANVDGLGDAPLLQKSVERGNTDGQRLSTFPDGEQAFNWVYHSLPRFRSSPPMSGYEES